MQNNTPPSNPTVMNSYRQTSWNWIFIWKSLDTQLVKDVAAYEWNLNFNFLANKNSLLDSTPNQLRSYHTLIHHFLLQDCFSIFSSIMLSVFVSQVTTSCFPTNIVYVFICPACSLCYYTIINPVNITLLLDQTYKFKRFSPSPYTFLPRLS